MKRNICKFVSPSVQVAIEVQNFVHETDRAVMNAPSKSEFNRAILVCDGSGEFHFDSHTVKAARGDLLFCFAGEYFSADCDENLQYMYISFTGNRASELFKRFGIGATFRTFEGFDGIIPLWQESLARATEENIDLCAESILLYTFSRLDRNTSKALNIVNEVIAISEESFNDPTLSITAIAQRLGYNPKYVSHVFKEKVGRTYSEYLRNLRIKYAISLFDHGIDSVKNVALLSGFGDSLYFSGVFKKEVGLSPTQYIEQKQKSDS